MDRGSNRSGDYPLWALWMWEHGALLFVGVGVGMLAIIIAVFAYVDYRLGQVEDRMRFVPPSSYQAPDLAQYAFEDVSIDELPVQKLVYVPVYSHVYYEGGAPYSLETTLSVRNSDKETAVFLSSVDYFDTRGKLVKKYLEQPIRLNPLQTIEFLVKRQDSTGGSGANFLVHWMADEKSNRPVIEAVMVGTAGTQGISFVRPGVELTTR